MQLANYAHLIERDRDTTTYQHAETLQVFRLVDLTEGNYGLYIFNDGMWTYQGNKTMPQIIQLAAEVG